MLVQFKCFSYFPPPSLSSRLSVAPRLFVAIRFDMRTRVLCFRVCPLTRLKRIALASLQHTTLRCALVLAFAVFPWRFSSSRPPRFRFLPTTARASNAPPGAGASPANKHRKKEEEERESERSKTRRLSYLVLVLLPRPFACRLPTDCQSVNSS